MRKNRLPLQDYLQGILHQDRIVLSKAITLIESKHPDDQQLAQQLLTEVLPHTGKSFRIGITGVPGVGKSTFIEAFGSYLTQQKKKMAILAIDPTSTQSKGSIMGDKTRMEALSMNPYAYIRPSPTSGSLGGVARKTRETMLLCEAAGFEIVMIETVGVGQSETLVKNMVDFFLLLMLAGAGDELQGIKKGIMEMADMLVITKADGTNKAKAQLAKQEYENALHLFRAPQNGWHPTVQICSALKNEGIASIWEQIEQFHTTTQAHHFFSENRKKQALHWMYETIERHLLETFYHHKQVKILLPTIEKQVLAGTLLPIQGAQKLLKAYWKQAPS
ncbi:MAG: methylmalonyl Co-A mutase-associated GTPase MeaB [Thermonemataceae bacterium]